jgi:hypothetical protein
MSTLLQPSTGACYVNGWFASGNRIVTYLSPYGAAPVIVDFPAARGSHITLRPNSAGLVNVDATTTPLGTLAALGFQPLAVIVAVSYP